MVAVRRHRLTTYLAVFAVALQMLLAFGHGHPHSHATQISLQPAAAVAPHAAEAGHGHAAASHALPAASDALHASEKSTEEDEESNCAICLAAAQSRNATLCEPQQFVPPLLAELSHAPAPAVVLRQANRRGANRARAPPDNPV